MGCLQWKEMKAPKTLLFISTVMMLTVACTEAPKQEVKKKEPEKPAEPITGRSAFFQMFVSARSWSPDVQPVQCTSLPIEGFLKATNGTAGAWRCLFASPSKGKYRNYTYSVTEAGGNLHKGVFHEPGEMNFSGSIGQAKPFLVQALKIDTDEAYKTALAKGGAEEFVKKNPDVPVNYLLELTPRFPQPTWRVIWGESVSTSQYSVFVDAATGGFLAKVR